MEVTCRGVSVDSGIRFRCGRNLRKFIKQVVHFDTRTCVDQRRFAAFDSGSDGVVFCGAWQPSLIQLRPFDGACDNLC